MAVCCGCVGFAGNSVKAVSPAAMVSVALEFVWLVTFAVTAAATVVLMRMSALVFVVSLLVRWCLRRLQNCGVVGWSLLDCWGWIVAGGLRWWIVGVVGRLSVVLVECQGLFFGGGLSVVGCQWWFFGGVAGVGHRRR